MEASYQIRSPFIGKPYSVSISENDYNLIKFSKDFLLEYMHFEECFLQLSMCLEEYEIFLLTGAQSYLLFPFSSYDFFQDQRVRANTKVLSFLNSMTSFRDQAPRLDRVISKKGAFRRRFRELWDREMASSVAFSFCDHLRNYAQHQTQPVHSVTVGGGWNKERTFAEHHTTVYVRVDKVCEGRNLSPIVTAGFKADLKTLADISVVIRESIGCVGKIVKDARDELKGDFDSSILVLEKWIDEASKHPEGSLTATVESLGSDKPEKFDIFPDFVERAKRLRQSLVLQNAEKHIVSNRPRGHKD